MFEAAVLVIEIVSMFPYIKTEKGTTTGGYRIASTRLLQNDKCSICRLRQPNPSRAKKGCTSLLKLLTEIVECSPLLFYGMRQPTDRHSPTLRRKLLKVERVIEHLPCIVEYHTRGMTYDVFQRLPFVLGAVHKAIERFHISCKMLTMVQLDGATAYHRFESLRSIRQLYQPPRSRLG